MTRQEYKELRCGDIVTPTKGPYCGLPFEVNVINGYNGLEFENKSIGVKLGRNYRYLRVMSGCEYD